LNDVASTIPHVLAAPAGSTGTHVEAAWVSGEI